ncbi:serine carboxypeptidase [Pelomyxa schiedti]|nr:serine carboxypeptidase [Pelomyxa schiedti]
MGCWGARVLWAVSVSVIVAWSAPNDHLITELPGIDNVTFAQYSGYVQVDSQTNKNLFYWFVESQRDPATDPVVLWMNGGPGASSLFGFFTEHGPFWPNPDGMTLHLNPYAWNRIANMIYLEAPAGVGFTYSDDPTDYTTGDDQTALDNYNFLVAWFKLYPEFQGNPFYVSGESYGGHYVPDLAQKILDLDTSHNINMKGILIGDPLINRDSYMWDADPNADAYPFVNFMYTHGFIPVESYGEASDICHWGSYLTDCAGTYTSPSSECLDAINKCLDYIPSNLDLYNVLAPVCLATTATQRMQYVSNWNPVVKVVAELQDQKAKQGPIASAVYTYNYDPCMQNYVTTYLNLPEVQTAIHARPTLWGVFESNLNYSSADFYINMVPVIQEFIDYTDWTIFVYSGALDGCVPFIGTQRWISCLGRPIVNDWRGWDFDSQGAGTVIDYDRITFMTVKASGHMVPTYAPKAGFAMFQCWMDDGVC